jgi:transposase-like protein
MSKRKGLEGLFDGRHFDREIIIPCVCWHLRYKLSLRDLVEMMRFCRSMVSRLSNGYIQRITYEMSE